MKKFENKVEVLCGTIEKVDSLLNELGKQGWELIKHRQRVISVCLF